MTKHEKISRLFEKSNGSPPNPWPLINEAADVGWIVSQSGLPWFKLDIEIPTDIILKEIQRAQHFLVPHRDQYGEHRGWKSFCLHGKSTEQTQHCDDDRPFHWIPEIQEIMPQTVEFFKSWPGGTYQRVRVMSLEPGGYVSLHRDNNTNYLGPINIAITQPEGCRFIMKDWGMVPFKSGDAYMLDVGNWHAVFNDSDETRYHIIIHFTEWTSDFQTLLVDSYKKMAAKEKPPGV